MDGKRPPLQPAGVVRALLAVGSGAADDEVLAALGPPIVATGSVVEGDVDALYAGQRTDLRLSARIEVVHGERWRTDQLRITNLPPDIGTSEVARTLTWKSERVDRIVLSTHEEWEPRRLAISAVNDGSAEGVDLLEVTPEQGVDLEGLVAQIAEIWGVHTVVDADFGRPVVEVLREWVAEHGEPDLEAQLAPIVSA